MTTSVEITPPPERISPEILKFKAIIGRANGTLIPLRKRAPNGQELLIAARLVSIPEEGKSERVDMGWTEETYHSDIDPDSILLIDAYSRDNGDLTPIGHIDWWGQKFWGYANGGGNMHAYVIPQNEHEVQAQEKWSTWYSLNTAFSVDMEYRKSGIGSLLLASSAVVLRKNGFRYFYSGVLLDPAKKTYRKFQIDPEDFPYGNWYSRNLPLTRLSKNPQVNKSIGDFVL